MIFCKIPENISPEAPSICKPNIRKPAHPFCFSRKTFSQNKRNSLLPSPSYIAATALYQYNTAPNARIYIARKINGSNNYDPANGETVYIYIYLYSRDEQPG